LILIDNQLSTLPILPKLNTVNMHKNPVSKEEQIRLRSALPNCKLYFS